MMSLTKVTYSMIDGASANVKDFGAIGNGVTDDTAAIQAAINSVGEGGAVYIPQGTYLVSSTITVTPTSNAVAGITIFGENNLSQIKTNTNGITSLIEVTGSQFTLSNLSLVKGTSNVSNAVYVNISGNSDVAATIRNCRIIGFPVGILGKGQNYYIEDNFLQNNTRHIKFADDGRNSSISGNYMLGGGIGVEFQKTSQQAEGVRIINNCMLLTGTNGGGVQIFAGLEILILGNVIDQTGLNTPAIFINPPSGEAVSSVKLIGNWLAAGENSYGIFSAGNNSCLHITDNTFVSNNNAVTLDAIALTDTNTYSIISNRFLMNLDVGRNDLVETNCVNGSLLANNSNSVGSSAIASRLDSGLAIGANFQTPFNSYASAFQIGVTGPFLRGGSGDPNGVVTGVPGSIWMRTDGGVGGHLYVCQGGTSWTAIAGV